MKSIIGETVELPSNIIHIRLFWQFKYLTDFLREVETLFYKENSDSYDLYLFRNGWGLFHRLNKSIIDEREIELYLINSIEIADIGK